VEGLALAGGDEAFGEGGAVLQVMLYQLVHRDVHEGILDTDVSADSVNGKTLLVINQDDLGSKVFGQASSDYLL
jgi:hypothetical protein